MEAVKIIVGSQSAFYYILPTYKQRLQNFPQATHIFAISKQSLWVSKFASACHLTAFKVHVSDSFRIALSTELSLAVPPFRQWRSFPRVPVLWRPEIGVHSGFGCPILVSYDTMRFVCIMRLYKCVDHGTPWSIKPFQFLDCVFLCNWTLYLSSVSICFGPWKHKQLDTEPKNRVQLHKKPQSKYWKDLMLQGVPWTTHL